VHPGVHPSGETAGNRYTCRLIDFTVQINPFLRESPVAGVEDQLATILFCIMSTMEQDKAVKHK